MLKLLNVSKEYITEDENILALRDINLDLESSGFVSIVGPSGCGKTTLLNMLGGLDHPTNGDLYFNNQNTKSYTDSDWDTYRNQKIGFVFQHYYLIPHLNIIQNIALPLSIAGYDQKSALEKAKDILITVGLKDKLYKKPNQLSGGQQQRASIARALVNNPKIILADEPIGSLDHESSLEIMELLKNISLDRLVVMVTHNMKLASDYSNQIITIDSGMIKDRKLNLPVKSKDLKPEINKNSAKMSFSTSFKLSFMNLMKRKLRTILTSLAASIGVIGITLVLAVAFGFNRFVEVRKTETLNAFPIQVDRLSLVVPLFDESYRPNLDLFPDTEIAYPRNIQYVFQTINTITPEYFQYVEKMNPAIYEHIHYNYKIQSNFVIENSGSIVNPGSVIKEIDVSEAYLSENFEVIKGRMMQLESFEAIITLDRYNRLSKDIAESLGFNGDDPISFDDLLGLKLKWIPNDVMYTLDGANYIKNSVSNVYGSALAIDIEIVGIVRIQEKFNIDYLRTGIFYSTHLAKHIMGDSKNSEIVVAQISSNINVIDNTALTQSTKDTALRNLGYGTYPLAYVFYSKTFSDKDLIMDYLKAYNDTVSINQAIEPLDLAGIGLATMRTAIDSVTIILIVFSGIALLISNLMIGIMTYTSVIERTKEIGILRSVGARKKDIGNIFYSETLMIGILSGTLGILISYLLIPFLNMILKTVTTIENLAYLFFPYAIILVIINILLTSISGIIPASIASNKDPILCLRNE
ncbi:MAG: ATP-binding cassette domain-containing protein [Acholeplasmataceae bacterium]|nr:ATP-binding cassette domain-containing protein [Acholeplasmataceae bacterium]